MSTDSSSDMHEPDFTEARDIEWQWHQLGNMQICTLLQTDKACKHPTTQFLHARCPSCHPTNSVKVLKAFDEVIGNNKVLQPYLSLLFWYWLLFTFNTWIVWLGRQELEVYQHL